MPPVTVGGEHQSYWHERVRAEARAALACDDPRIAAIHVDLATRCLKMASVSAPALSDPETEARPLL